MKKLSVVFVAGFLLVLSSVVFAATVDRCLPGSAVESCESGQTGQIVAEAFVISEIEYKTGPFDISYPRFSGMRDKVVEGRINAELQQRADDFIAIMKLDIEKGKDFPFLKKFAAKMNYEVYFTSKDLASLTLSTYKFTGGAHGSSTLEGYTFNLETGQRLKYRELFKWDEEKRESIDCEIARQIKERKIPIFEPYKGISDDPEFYLKSNNVVVFVFQQYEIAPYSSGILRFEMAY